MKPDSVNNHFLSNITIEKAIAFIFLVIVFSFDFHALWLLYDFLALFAMYFFFKNTNIVLASILFMVLSFFITLTFVSGFHLVSILSIWDNIKHIFILFLLLSLVERHINLRILEFANSFGFIIGCVFILQSLLFFYQYFNSYFKDDISGTFGTASGHTFAYYCLLYISYLFYIKKSYVLTFCVFILSLVMNYLSENMGYYPLVILLLSYHWMTPRRLKYMVFYVLVLLFIVFIIDNLLGGVLIQPILYRFSEFFLLGNIDLDEFNLGRGYMTVLALYLGGWWGSGPGCYSEIYSIVGWEVVEKIKINISSITNLLAEYGIVGVLTWISLYLFFIKRFFKKRKDFLFISMLLIFSMLYNKVLNDERVIFLLIFTMMFMKIHIYRENRKYD